MDFNMEEKIQEQLRLLLDKPEIQKKITDFVSSMQHEDIQNTLKKSNFGRISDKERKATHE